MNILRSFGLFMLVLASVSGGAIAQSKQAPAPGPSDMVSDRLPDAVIAEEDLPGNGPDGLISVTSYPLTVLGGIALEDMSSGTTQLIGPAIDDNNSTLQNIGFTFRFDGVNHTSFGVNTNGFISLGIAPTGTSFTNSIATTANQPKIMAFWDDLCTGTTGQVHFKTIGSPGSRKLIVEWQNMKITRNGTCTAAVGNGTFQLWLFEGTGVVQFVYGAGTPATTADGGYSVGLQAAGITNFASVTTNGGTVSYAAANNAQMDAISAGTSYAFTPNVPLAATGINFTSVTQTSMSVNWTDNATNETGYVVSRSTDGTNYTVIGTPAANANTFPDTGLVPGTTYFYRINAVTEGASSANLDGSQATNPAGNISSTGSGGLWSAPATWAGGVVPAAGDNVTIENGDTVTIDTAAVALSVSIGPSNLHGKGASPEGAGAILQFDSAAAQSLTVGGNVSIGTDDIFRSATTGTVTTHNLSLGGDLENDGTLDFSTNGDTAGAGITFTGAQDNSFGGAGGTTDIRTITVNKGTSNANDLEVNPTNFTVQGSMTDTAGSGYLTLINGTFRMSGTFTGTHRTFATAAYTIPATAGFWLSNPNYTVAAQTGNATVNGLLRNSLGTYNVGTAADNSVAFGIGSTIFIEGGAVNTAGRFGVGVAATTAINYTQTGGNITTCMVGSTSTTLACWDLGTSTAVGVVYNITGGTVVVQNASTAASGPRDYRLQSGPTGTGTTNVTGGLVQFGNAATTGVQAFDGAGVFPSFEVDTTAGAHTFTMLAPVTWNNLTRHVTIEAGGTFNIGNNVYLFNGVNFVNNGVFTANGGTAANFVPFDPAANCVVTGSGTFTGITNAIGMQAGTITFNQANQWRVRNLRVFTGSLVNANKITLGNNDATVNVVQFGNTTTPTLAGTLDVAPVFDLGTGGQTISYLRTGNMRTTGPEVNPARTLVTMTYDNNDPATDELTVAGGDLTVTGAMTLTNGEIKTGANKITHNGAVTRTNGFINGTLNRSYTATGNYTYHVGQTFYSPVFFLLGILNANPSTVSVKPVDATLPGLAPATAVSRYWTVTQTGNFAGRLDFTYNDADINGNEADYQAWLDSGSGPVAVGGVINPATNTQQGPQPFTDFQGNWGIGTALAPVVPVNIGGRITAADGRGIRNITVVLSGGSLPAPLTVQTGMLGTYNFEGVTSGQTYTITVKGSRFTFTPNTRNVTPFADVTNEDFVADPGFGVRTTRN